MEKVKDSAILARLIYRSYCATDPPVIDMTVGPFCDSLEFYAKTRIRELIDEGKLELVSDSDAAPPDAEESTPAPAPESPTVLAAPTFAAEEVRPVIPADTHTHTSGPLEGEGSAPGTFAGKGSGEKKAIFEHLTAFVATHGAGARKKIADTSNGALTVNELFEMCAAQPYQLAKWRVAEAAMKHLEQKEGNNAAEKV